VRKSALIALLLLFACCITVFAQAPTPPPQSARQALIEMFMSKNPEDFGKHLPDAARQALIHKGETPESSFVLRLAQIGRQMTSSGEHVETFDVGPNILVSEQNEGHEKIEIAVEHDSLLGEEDEIELSIHVYKDGQPQPLPVVPRLIFTLKQEKEVWRLNEVTAAAHVPLTDPDYLKTLRNMQDKENEGAAQMRVTSIVVAETGFAAKHPDRGYTCSTSELFAPDPEANPDAPRAYLSFNQPGDESSGYRFTLSGCEGSPASKYRLLAEPTDPDSEMKTFCADQTGTVKSMSEGKGSSCFSHGQVLDAPGGSPVTD